MYAALTREDILSLRPPVVELTLPGYERVSFRTLAVGDFGSLISRRDLSPIEFAVETLAGQAEDLPNAATLLCQLPRPTLLRLARSWATHPSAFGAAPSQIRRFSDFKATAESKVDEWNRTMRELGQRLAAPLTAQFSEINRQLTDLLSKQMKALVDSFNSVGSKVEDDARELGKRGWTMPMWGPLDLVRHLGQFTAQELDEILQQQYSRRRNELERELLAGLLDRPALLHWRSLLFECIDAYRRRKYRVIVPSLFTIVEGAIVSAINLFSRRPGPNRVAAQRVSAYEPGVARAAWVSVQAFVDEVFCDHSFGAPRRSLINRHWVCHGRDVPEWGRVDCLRLFQALDTISTLVGSGLQRSNGKGERTGRKGS